MTELEQLIDERNILRLLYRYAHALDARDADLWSSCFTPDATLVSRHGMFVGTEELDGVFRKLPVAPTKHLVTSPLIELDGDTAIVVSHFLLCLQNGTELSIDFFGRYLDRVSRVGNDDWRFEERRIVGEAEAVRA